MSELQSLWFIRIECVKENVSYMFCFPLDHLQSIPKAFLMFSLYKSAIFVPSAIKLHSFYEEHHQCTHFRMWTLKHYVSTWASFHNYAMLFFNCDKTYT